ncbi:tetratricopeptide repeat protein [Micromonospora sp. NPDC047557]|uniref:tetratricopeptide repeat protein n=1 Tax=Micromonospora sp. NPDC047557 TaxID=3364250 RepID=UPI003722FE9B
MAITLFEQALADYRRVLGDDHPSTLASGNNLAYAYRAVGRVGEAITLLEQVLADSRRVLCDDDPQTRTIAANLQHATDAAGSSKKAAKALPKADKHRRNNQGSHGRQHEATPEDNR